MLPFAFIGVCGGLLGAFIIKMHVIVTSFRRATRIKRFPVQEVLFFAALTGVCSFLNDFMRGGATELMAVLFDECGHRNDALSRELCKYEPHICTHFVRANTV